MKKVSRVLLLQRGPRQAGAWMSSGHLPTSQNGRLAYRNGSHLEGLHEGCAFGGKILSLVEPGKSIKVRVTVEVLDD